MKASEGPMHSVSGVTQECYEEKFPTAMPRSFVESPSHSEGLPTKDLCIGGR